MNYKKLKRQKKYHQEMHDHYRQIYDVACKELRFSRIQTNHYKSVLDEVEELIKKGVKKDLILKVIDIGHLRETLDVSIHYDIECGGIDKSSFT